MTDEAPNQSDAGPPPSRAKQALSAVGVVVGCLVFLAVVLLVMGGAVWLVFVLWPPASTMGVAMRAAILGGVVFFGLFVAAGHHGFEVIVETTVAAIVCGALGAVVASGILELVGGGP